MSTEPITVCVDYGEDGSIAGCYVIEEDCTTGVINELGWCEPVGTSGDVEDVVATGVPPLPTETAILVRVAPDPPTLPATGTTEGVFAAVGCLLLFAGLGLTWVSRVR